MKRLLVVLLCAAIVAPGCAVRTASRAPSTLNGDRAVQAPEIPRSYAQELPVGRQVEVRLKSGERFKGTYMGVEGDAIRVQPSTRVPVPPRVILLADLSVLRLDQSGASSPARAILIGVASGAATFFGLILFSIAAWAD